MAIEDQRRITAKLSGDSRVTLEVAVPDMGALSDEDRGFVEGLVDVLHMLGDPEHPNRPSKRQQGGGGGGEPEPEPEPEPEGEPEVEPEGEPEVEPEGEPEVEPEEPPVEPAPEA